MSQAIPNHQRPFPVHQRDTSRLIQDIWSTEMEDPKTIMTDLDISFTVGHRPIHNFQRPFSDHRWPCHWPYDVSEPPKKKIHYVFSISQRSPARKDSFRLMSLHSRSPPLPPKWSSMYPRRPTSSHEWKEEGTVVGTVIVLHQWLGGVAWQGRWQSIRGWMGEGKAGSFPIEKENGKNSYFFSFIILKK